MSNRTPEDIIIASYRQFAGKSPEEVLTSSEMTIGFDLLNDSISAYNSDGSFISYEATVFFNTVPFVGQYVLTNKLPPIVPPPPPQPSQVFVPSNPIVQLNFVNFLFGNVVYPVRIISKNEFYNSIRVNNVPGLPYYCFLDQQEDLSIVTLYPVPNIVYGMEVRGKIRFNYLQRFSVVQQIPEYFFKFLRYELGKELVSFYRQVEWLPSDNIEYERLRKRVISSADWQCSLKTDMSLNFSGPYYPYAVNGIVII